VTNPELPFLDDVTDAEIDALVESIDASVDASFLADMAEALERTRQAPAEDAPAAVA
jgi:hypothetical protein